MTLEVRLGRLLCLPLLATLIILASCSHKSYLDVKKEFVAGLERDSDWGSQSNYRLAIIPPIAESYRPGTPLAKGSYDALTNSCLIEEQYLISSFDIASPPVTLSQSTFNLSLGLPPILQIAKTALDLQVGVGASDTAVFNLSVSRSVSVRQDDLYRAMLNVDCFTSIVGRDIVMVRGLIYGSEIIGSYQGVGATAESRTLGTSNLSVKYDSIGGYEVRDTVDRPKFWIVSDMRIDIPGLTPSTSPAERFALIQQHVGNKLAGVSFHEKAPSKATVKDLEDKVPPMQPTNLRVLGVE